MSTNKTDETINTCVVGISTSHPYDTSVFINNSTTFYTKINYLELIKLFDLISLEHDKLDKHDEPDEFVKSNKKSSEIVSIEMNLLYIVNCFTDPSIKILFRFLCSPDCHDGTILYDENITLKVYEFVKLVSKYNCIIEFSDHSMGSFFTNWDDDIMGIKNPIEILPITHCGSFKMYGQKNDFINSSHPTLKQIGNLSSSENIEITFNNLVGTKVYKILSENVKVISEGEQVADEFNKKKFKSQIKSQIKPEFKVVPVHCEFVFQSGIIVLSSTHWCNLDSVNTPIDLLTLKRFCTDSLGIEATQNLEMSLLSVNDHDEYTKIISDTVRQISSGTKN